MVVVPQILLFSADEYPCMGTTEATDRSAPPETTNADTTTLKPTDHATEAATTQATTPQEPTITGGTVAITGGTVAGTVAITGGTLPPAETRTTTDQQQPATSSASDLPTPVVVGSARDVIVGVVVTLVLLMLVVVVAIILIVFLLKRRMKAMAGSAGVVDFSNPNYESCKNNRISSIVSAKLQSCSL